MPAKKCQQNPPFVFREEDRYMTWEEDGEEVTIDLNAFVGNFDKVAELLNLPQEEVESFISEMQAYHQACEAEYKAREELQKSQEKLDQAYQAYTDALAKFGKGDDLIH